MKRFVLRRQLTPAGAGPTQGNCWCIAYSRLMPYDNYRIAQVGASLETVGAEVVKPAPGLFVYVSEETYQLRMTLISAYQRGYNCSMSGVYPATCPFEEGTVEYAEWWEGFGDATEDYIANQRLS